jgi:hypothetical protein
LVLFRGVNFRRRSPPAQTTSFRDSCPSRCTTSPALFLSLNHLKRCSIGDAIVFQR